MKNKKIYDVIIIGGSYAGLSAAMALGRSLRQVLIIDGGLPCNKPTPKSHNFITQDGSNPKDITELAKKQVLKYNTVKFIEDFAISGVKSNNNFMISTNSGKTFITKKIVFATGIIDTIPDIKGFIECWGKSIVHCPYCHGFELRDRKTAILADAQKAKHLSVIIKNLTNYLTIINSRKEDFNPLEVNELKQKNINVINENIKEIEHNNGYLKNIVLTNGNKFPLEVLYASLPFKQHSDIPKVLGCIYTELGYIQVDNYQKTSVDSVFACGDNSGMMRSVAHAVHAGNLTGAIVNSELAMEEFQSE